MDSPIFLIDGGDVVAFPSIADAEGGSEIYDIEGYQYFDAEGTVLDATADGYRVRLVPTAERRLDELRGRLDAYLRHPRVGIDPALANDPRRVAALLIGRQREQVWPRWPKWLHRLVHKT